MRFFYLILCCFIKGCLSKRFYLNYDNSFDNLFIGMKEFTLQTYEYMSGLGIDKPSSSSNEGGMFHTDGWFETTNDYTIPDFLKIRILALVWCPAQKNHSIVLRIDGVENTQFILCDIQDNGYWNDIEISPTFNVIQKVRVLYMILSLSSVLRLKFCSWTIWDISLKLQENICLNESKLILDL